MPPKGNPAAVPGASLIDHAGLKAGGDILGLLQVIGLDHGTEPVG